MTTRPIVIKDVYPLLAGQYYAEPTEAGIRAAVAAANADGGGTVIIPAGTIALTSPLPLYSGVIYKGTGYSPSFTITGSYGGTILTGDGSFPAFSWNAEDGTAAPDSFTLFNDGDGTAANPGMVRGAGVIELTMVNFSHGVKVGAKYKAGAQWSRFERLNFMYCNQWALYLENGAMWNIAEININYTTRQGPPTDYAVGMIYIGGSGGAVMHTGNSAIRDVYAARNDYRTRGLVFEARGDVSTRNNLIGVENIYVLTDITEYTKPAAMIDNQYDITVGSVAEDGAVFPVGMPVTVSETANGFAAGTLYFVVSQSSNIIQLASSVEGSPIQATGHTAVNIKTFGRAKIELLGLTETDQEGIDQTSYVTSMTMSGLDMIDGGASCSILLQNASQNQLSLSSTNTDKEYATVVLRVATQQNTINSASTYSYDLGTGSQQNFFYGPVTNFANLVTGYGLRQIVSDGTPALKNGAALFLTGYAKPDIFINPTSNGLQWSSSLTFDQVQFAGSANSLDQLGQYVGFVCGSTADGLLPLITSGNVGLFLIVSNPQAEAVTLNTRDNQTVNNGSAMSVTIAMRSTAILMACAYRVGSAVTYYWAQK